MIIDGYENVPANDEDALMKAAANQPISVAIDAGGSDFQLFSEVLLSFLVQKYAILSVIAKTNLFTCYVRAGCVHRAVWNTVESRSGGGRVWGDSGWN